MVQWPGLLANVCFTARRASQLMTLLSVVYCTIICFTLTSTSIAAANDWSLPSRQLAQKVAALTGPGVVAVTTANRSSLDKKDCDTISGRIRSELEVMGVREVPPEQAAASVQITLSENPRLYVWVAEIRQGNGDPAVAIVSMPRENDLGVVHDSMPVSLHKIPLWGQQDRILDVVVLDENIAPQHMAVLDGEKLTVYRQKNSSWLDEQSFPISHARTWPRDLRGMLIPGKDHLFDVYLPGVFCQTSVVTPLSLKCRESDDPWPLQNAAGAQTLGGFYAASRNFYTGALTPGIGKLTNVGKFYSAAAIPRANYVLWLFAGADGLTHLVDGMAEQTAKLNWGSDLVSVRTGCGAGWQVLASGQDDDGSGDSLRAYEIADRDPVPVSAPLGVSGEITALWPDVKYDSAIAIVHDRERGEYEAFRVALSCGG